MTMRTCPLMMHSHRKWAVAVFGLTLLAFVIESELTQYVQTTLQYRQPFFLFYVVHSSLSMTFPLHLLYLFLTTKYTASSLFNGLAIAISNHLAPEQKNASSPFPVARFLRLALLLTAGITIPSLLWFAAVSLASLTDVTAIWNTNAFFTYVISLKAFNLKWEARPLLAVVLATIGTFAVVYGGVAEPSANISLQTKSAYKPSAPLIGDLLSLLGSLGYGLYTVFYKAYAALPSHTNVTTQGRYEAILGEEEDAAVVPPLEAIDMADAIYPPPFGFHPNLMTSLLGLFTFILLWIPIPFLHWSQAESFRLPPDRWTTVAVAGIMLSGMVFNAGFMILLGIWGPIIVSVGNLLTIVLVLIADVVFGPGVNVLTLWSLLGAGGIVLAFAVLSYDTFRKESG